MCQCSLAMGRLTSGLKSITLIVYAGAFIQLIVLLWLLLKYSVTTGVLGILYPLLMEAALGIGVGIFNTQLNALLGMLFKHDMEGAFAQLKSASLLASFYSSLLWSRKHSRVDWFFCNRIRNKYLLPKHVLLIASESCICL